MLEKYVENPEDPRINFDLGIWYEQKGQLAAAFSFYLRCAERSINDDLTYQALLRAAGCVHIGGDHPEIVEDLVEHAKSTKKELIDIVLQGQYTNYTDVVANYYLELPFVNQVIISCWETDKEEVKDPKIKFVRSKFPDIVGTGNRNLQIISSLAGLKVVDTKFSVKIRSDQKYSHQAITRMYEHFFRNKERVITFQDDETKPRNRIFVGGSFPEFPFHPKDHIMWGNTEDLIDVFSLPLEQHSIYTRAGIQQKDYWKYYKYFVRTESYIGAFYCANFDERIRIFLLEPKDYLYDESKCRDETMSVSDWLTPKVFKSFPKEMNELEWPKYGWTEYPFQQQRDQFGERWDEDGV
jgi:hypothetical protein